MFKKAVDFISKANQILFFLAIIIIIGFVLMTAYPFLFPSKYERPRVQLIENSIDDSTKVVKNSKQYLSFTKDIHVIKILANTINSKQHNRPSKTFNLFSSRDDGKETVNFIFVDEHGHNQKLFINDLLIQRYTLSDDENLKNTGYSLSKNIYLVIHSDTNNDGFLSEDDSKSLYLSSYKGDDVNLVIENIQRYELIGDNKLLIEKEDNTEKDFYIYNVKSSTLSKLNTNFN